MPFVRVALVLVSAGWFLFNPYSTKAATGSATLPIDTSANVGVKQPDGGLTRPDGGLDCYLGVGQMVNVGTLFSPYVTHSGAYACSQTTWRLRTLHGKLVRGITVRESPSTSNDGNTDCSRWDLTRVIISRHATAPARFVMAVEDDGRFALCLNGEPISLGNEYGTTIWVHPAPMPGGSTSPTARPFRAYSPTPETFVEEPAQIEPGIYHESPTPQQPCATPNEMYPSATHRKQPSL